MDNWSGCGVHEQEDGCQVRAEGAEGQPEGAAGDRHALAGQRLQTHRQHQGRVREHAQQGEVPHGRHGVVSIRQLDVWSFYKSKLGPFDVHHIFPLLLFVDFPQAFLYFVIFYNWMENIILQYGRRRAFQQNSGEKIIHRKRWESEFPFSISKISNYHFKIQRQQK